MQTALLLIALGFGFKVFADASKNPKKTIRAIGRLVGIIMMILGLTGAICTTWAAIQYGSGFSKFGWCPQKTSMSGYSKPYHRGFYHGGMTT